ncbi:hypothetical protein GCM10017566_66540 [Amycolatopsis bartoniae]|uniref:Alpha/beta hydrolase fold-3 domain-containing protein n=1 Tax=Amycolatopsis bartoniae TaxID=941986 RepID=A0A8H9MDY6_9PSEU|nr:hypothetical protein GCM10017566_66540 [Amycolatopsis bartoniae]
MPALVARSFQVLFPVLGRLLLESPKLQFATKPVAAPERITIPTRHGTIPALLHSPVPEDIVARYLASEVGCYVVLPDYDVSPQVRFPVAEQECYGAYRWLLDRARDRGAGTGTGSRSAEPARARSSR